MCEIFKREDIFRVLKGKSLLFLGDSIMRNIYKDLVWMSSALTTSDFIPQQHMRDKGEKEFLEDKLINGLEKTSARNYTEERDYYIEQNDMQFSFIFITRCFSPALEKKILTYEKVFGSYPDFIIINSALWDINRWGPEGIEMFKKNIHSLMTLFKKCLPDYTQVVWMTTPPISAQVRGGFMIQNLDFTKQSMRFNIMEGNQYAANVAASYGYDVLDMHYYMLNQIHRRAPDGIHWNFDGVRLQVNIVLTHYCLSQDIKLPQRSEGCRSFLAEAKEIAQAAETDFFHVTGDPERFPRKKAVGKRSDTRRDPKFKVPNSSWKSKNNITPDQDYEKYKDCQWGWSQNSSGAIWDWSNYPNNNLFGTTNTGINKNHGERDLDQPSTSKSSERYQDPRTHR